MAAPPPAQFKGTRITAMPGGGAYGYRIDRMAIDADGAPDTYHPDDTGSDALTNAGYGNPHRDWWPSVLVPDPADPAQAYIDPGPGPGEGYYVSKTSLEDARIEVPATSRAKYVDARAIPYVVFPTAYYQLAGTGHLGDFALALNLRNGQVTAAIVADTGGGADAGLGEVSIALAEALGGVDVNPRNARGAPEGPFGYVLFPGSHATPPWPLTLAAIRQGAARRYAAAGGWPSASVVLQLDTLNPALQDRLRRTLDAI